MLRSLTLLLLLSLLLPIAGCSDQSAPHSAEGLTKVKLALNWVPEPEFGGFYAAQPKLYEENGLAVEILPGGAGTPTVQMVGAGQVQFGIASADEVLIARARGVDLVALFAVYQDCPQGIMVHESRGFKKLADVFASEGTLALELGLPYGKFLKNKYNLDKVKIVPYAGGVAQFLSDPNMGQQCFIFSEPIAAKRQGAHPKVFLIAESGYNPYTAVVVTRGDYLREHRATCAAMVKAVRAGWQQYLADPAPANQVMGELNQLMDAETFALAAAAQQPLIENAYTQEHGLGVMTADRWAELGRQLVKLGVIEKAAAPGECFVDLGD